jgi:hypothetical protein
MTHDRSWATSELLTSVRHARTVLHLVDAETLQAALHLEQNGLRRSTLINLIISRLKYLNREQFNQELHNGTQTLSHP